MQPDPPIPDRWTPAEIDGVLTFLRAAEQLKQTLRSSHTSLGRPESVAEHSWRLCLMAILLCDAFPEVDFGKLIRMCVVHDLGEAIGGDIPAVAQNAAASKSARERRDLLHILGPLPDRLRAELLALWDEYDAAASTEARIARALDKLETILQHNQGKNPPGFNYWFNLQYGRQYTTCHPLIAAIREILDQETMRRASEVRETSG
ncbi:MAG: HD domain-containing protein [Chloroflexaceae bacterium]